MSPWARLFASSVLILALAGACLASCAMACQKARSCHNQQPAADSSLCDEPAFLAPAIEPDQPPADHLTTGIAGAISIEARKDPWLGRLLPGSPPGSRTITLRC